MDTPNKNIGSEHEKYHISLGPHLVIRVTWIKFAYNVLLIPHL